MEGLMKDFDYDPRNARMISVGDVRRLIAKRYDPYPDEGSRFQEGYAAALGELVDILPDMIEHDERPLQAARQKRLEFGQKLLGEVLGVPANGDGEKLLPKGMPKEARQKLLHELLHGVPPDGDRERLRTKRKRKER
jgi:hypothetical protein